MKDGKIVSTTIFDGGGVEGSKFILTTTRLTKWGVKGTFSEKLRRPDGSNFITVTGGKSAPYNRPV